MLFPGMNLKKSRLYDVETAFCQVTGLTSEEALTV
jgi:hypothetical protein